jgi:hypothetical protein
VTKATTFFRYVWRVNALLILIAAAAAAFGVVFLLASELRDGMHHRAEVAATPVVASASHALSLGTMTLVEGTSIYRAKLSTNGSARGSSFSSGGYAPETHNLLLVERESAAAHWLLPSDKDVISYQEDLGGEGHDASHPPIASVALVKPPADNLDLQDGRLLVFDIGGKQVHELASGVRQVHAASASSSGEITVIFEKKREYHLAILDPGLQLRSDRVIMVPPVK